MAALDAGVLPMIKCSNCGIGVEILAMGDHICGQDREPSPTPPAPPPKSGEYEVSPPAGYLWESKQKPLPQIDSSMANRPFIQTGDGDAPYSPPKRSNTNAAEPPSPEWDNDIPAFPIPRSMSNRRPAAYADMKAIGSAPPVPIPKSPYAMDQNPMTARPDFDTDLPPPPLPKDGVAPLPEFPHRRGDSVDSRSSYGTASIVHGDIGSKRSTMASSRRPSFGSVYQNQNTFFDDRMSAMRSGPLETLAESPSQQEPMGWRNLEGNNEQQDAPYSSFDFGIPVERNNRDAVICPGDSPKRLQVSPHHGQPESGSELFQQHSQYQGSHSPGLSVDMPDLSKQRSPSATSLSSNGQYHTSRPSGSSHYLQPGTHSYDEDNRRKNSDASEGGNNSVSNFARALGLENGEHHSAESSTASSEFSPSESRSGTSLSSLPSEASLSRRKASEASRLGPVVEEHSPPPTQDRMDENAQSDSPTALQPPRIPDPMQVPDSPTDPAISKGSLALICDTHSPRSADSAESPSDRSPISPAKERPAGILVPPTPRIGRPKGRCRGCGEAILGKSVSSADGRLTGRYHRECFACCSCRIPFQTADFYVIDNRPYCAQHYHELNGSICSACSSGIEGHYLETDERRGRGPGDRRKFHTDCLTCRTCNVVLKGDYFEWNGQVYCERDARRAAASVPPHRFRRPTLTSSPLARPGFHPGPGPPGPMDRPPFPPPGPGRRPPPPMGPDGLGPPGPYGAPYGPPSPGPGMRRFPERRTTRLMMI